jgi:hypothetical protein
MVGATAGAHHPPDGPRWRGTLDTVPPEGPRTIDRKDLDALRDQGVTEVFLDMNYDLEIGQLRTPRRASSVSWLNRSRSLSRPKPSPTVAPSWKEQRLPSEPLKQS